jgi:dihydrodipicolinate synthase/N-acetylneuraminate lyase
VVDELSYHPNIFGLKDSERNIERLDESIRLWGEREDFDFLIGWAPMAAYGLQKGADGIVPSTGNISPELYVRLIQAVEHGEMDAAFALQEVTDRISALYQKERSLSQSIPALKTLMNWKGLCSGEVLPPMNNMSNLEKESYLAEVTPELEKLLST